MQTSGLGTLNILNFVVTQPGSPLPGWFTVNPPNTYQDFWLSPDVCIFSDTGDPATDDTLWNWPTGKAKPVALGNVNIPQEAFMAVLDQGE